MASDTENSDEFVIHVKLLSEIVDVWRPVKAIKMSGDVFKISKQEIPAGEIWEFGPGSFVGIEQRHDENGAYLVAVKSAKENI